MVALREYAFKETNLKCFLGFVHFNGLVVKKMLFC